MPQSKAYTEQMTLFQNHLNFRWTIPLRHDREVSNQVAKCRIMKFANLFVYLKTCRGICQRKTFGWKIHYYCTSHPIRGGAEGEFY
jgi:hypothetical protein